MIPYNPAMDHTLFLFDIDGTIMKTGGAGVRAMHVVGMRMFGEHVTIEPDMTAGKLDPLIFAEFAEKNEIADHHLHLEAFREAYLVELEEELERERHNVQVLPGIRDAIQILHEDDRAVLGLLTGNFTAAVPIKFKAIGLDVNWFPIKALGDMGPTRPDLVLVAMKNYREMTGKDPDPKKIIVIGDTPRDIECAKAHGCVAFAVATGRYSLESLKEDGADIAVPDLSDLSSLLQFLD